MMKVSACQKSASFCNVFFFLGGGGGGGEILALLCSDDSIKALLFFPILIEVTEQKTSTR